MDLNNEELKKDLEEQYAILEEEVQEDNKKKRNLIVFLFFLFLFLGIFGSTFSYIRLYNNNLNLHEAPNLLIELDVEGVDGLINFDNSVHTYVVELAKGTKKIDFSFTLGNPEYKITIDGNEDLKPGINTVKIVVTDDDGREEEYIIYVYVEEDKKPDVIENVSQSLNLVDLNISNHSLNKEFKPSVTTYVVNNIKHNENFVRIKYLVEDDSVKKTIKLNNADVTKLAKKTGTGSYYIDLNPETDLTLGTNKFEVTLTDNDGKSKTYYLFLQVVDGVYVVEVSVVYDNLNHDGKYIAYEIVPGWESEENQEFTVINKSNFNTSIDVKWTNVKNSFKNTNDLEYEFYKGNVKLSSGKLPTKDSILLSGISVPANSSTKYSIKYKYNYRDENQNEDQGKEFSTVISTSISK